MRGLDGPLVHVGPKICAARIRAVWRGEQSPGNKEVAIEPTHHLHELTPVLGQISGRDSKIGPRLWGVCIQPLAFPSWRADAVTADDDGVFQLRLRLNRWQRRGQRRNNREKGSANSSHD